jgi:ABC-type branched-subunit amino acid transport system ATPase component/predicted MFS family arabinose efflux permease
MAERAGRRSFLGGASAAPLALLMGIDAIGEVDRIAFGVLLPEIRDWFGVSLTVALTLQTVSSLIIIALAVPMGFLADRWPRVKLTVIGLVGFGVVAFFTGLAPTLTTLAVIRLGAGLVRIVSPSTQSLLADFYPLDVRTPVFSVFQAGESVARFVGPIVAGYAAAWIGWQLPFVALAPVALVLAAVVLLMLKEPERGRYEREEAGLQGENLEQTPPGFAESWRIAKGVRTLRRVWWAMPFLVGAVTILGDLLSLLLSDVFDLDSGARGTIIAAEQPFRIAGLLLGAWAGRRFFSRRPGTVVTVAGLIGVWQGLMILFTAMAPTWWLAIAPFYLGSFATAMVGPALISLMTMVIPPRARGFALGVGAVFIAPGLLVGPFLGAIADSYGLRVGIALSAPLFVVGAIIIASAGTSVDADIRQARAAAAAASASLALGEGSGAMLVIRDLDVHYGGVQVLFNVDFDVEDGEIVALLGTNGAGKSTLLRAIAGTQPPSNGAVFFNGEDITHLPPSAHALAGVVTMPGGKAVFPSLTVREHLKLAASVHEDRSGIDRVLEMFPRLRERLDQPAGELSGGEQQMLGLGQALLTRPKLLMIDELSLGLSPAVVGQLLDVVRQIHSQGTTVILVEQSINVAFTIAERAVFMEKGEIRFSGPTAELLDRPDILRAVFLSAGSGAGGGGRRATATTDIVFETRNLQKRYGGIVATDDVSLQLRDGQILGLIGPNGSGKTTLFELISGFVEADAGEVILLGEDITLLGPEQRARLGIHRSFQDARLFPALTVEETVMVALEKRLEARSTLLAALGSRSVTRAERKIAKRADRLVDLLGLGGFRDAFVRELSTGTRRIVDLACVLAAEPKIVLLDEPSAGVAQRETEELGPLLQRVRTETGCSILLIEHDMPLISAVADELVALDQGRVLTQGRPADVLAHPDVVSAYLGTSEAAVNRSSVSVGKAST